MVEELVSSGLAPAWLSLFVGYVVGVGGLLGMTIRGWRRAVASRRRARQADAAVLPDAPLREGFTAVAGVVEYAQGSEHAVRVEIEQDGTEHSSSGNWTTRWTEKRRTIQVSPFYIRRPDGARVRVEPTQEAYLVDALDGVVRVNLAKRVRVAELVPDEHVIAIGELSHEADDEAEPSAAGYRDGVRRGWVLRAPRNERLLLSTEKVGARFLRRSGLHWLATAFTLLSFLAIHAALVPFHARALAGVDRTGTITRSWPSMSTDDDGETSFEFHVLVSVGDSGFADEVDRAGARAGDEVAVRWVPSWTSASAVGSSIRMHWFFVVMMVLCAALGTIAHAAAGSRAIGWYDSTRFVESNAGRLGDAPGTGRRRR